MKEFEERLLKRWLKRKVKITLGVIVAFFISGSVGYANNISIKFENNNIIVEPNDMIEISNSALNFNNKANNLIIDSTIIKDLALQFKNNGSLISTSTGSTYVVENFGELFSLENNGIIEGNSKFIVCNYNKINLLDNKGTIKGIYGLDEAVYTVRNYETIEILKNSGLIYSEANTSTTILNGGEKIVNEGNIITKAYSSGESINNQDYNKNQEINNKGLISTISTGESIIWQSGVWGILERGVNEKAIGDKRIINSGIISTKNDLSSDFKTYGIGIWDMTFPSEKTMTVLNDGIISAYGKKSVAIGFEQEKGTKLNVSSNGIIYSDKGVFSGIDSIEKIDNNGILIGNLTNIKDLNNKYTNNGIMFSYDSTNKNYKIQGYKDTDNNEIKVGEKTIINAELVNEQNKNQDNWTATGSNSIDLDGDKSNMIYNGITDTLKVNGEEILTNSIVNGYTSAIVFGENGSLTLNNSIINGGVDEVSATIKGSSSTDNLVLTNGTIINGNIDLGAGADKLSIDNTVQLNGDLLGGVGDDSLTFNSKGISTFGSEDDNNINIFNRVEEFENINVATDVTLFESAEVVGAGSIAIQKDGNLVLRIDSTNNNNHALSKNTGTISSEGGKLLLALNGVGEGETISFGDTSLDETMKGNENGFKEATIDTTSLLHNIKKIDNKTVKVSTEENIPYVNAVNYNELNRIYQSLRSIDGVGEFNVTDDKALAEFTNYLHDIYANNPYSFSSTLSRKSVNMFSNIVMDRDLHPEVNKWAIYGGLTHIDGGTKDTYYGKGYYTYDIGSKDIDVDSKITGMYAQGEYGVNETLNLGVIFGGNQSESEINSNSKVEGDSFYLGAYAKKYLGNLRLLAGVGYQYGDYKADRVAVGYDGITTTRTFDSNYNDNTFNIYAQAKYSNKLAENLYLEPSVALDYTYINQDGVSEDGVLAIETDDKDFNYVTAKFGVDLRKDIPTTSATHSLVAGAYYNRMLDGYEEENITGRFVGGSDFDILVSPSNKHELGLRAKYEVELNNGVTFDVKGSYTFARESYSGENKNEHKGEWLVGIGIGYKF